MKHPNQDDTTQQCLRNFVEDTAKGATNDFQLFQAVQKILVISRVF